MSNASIAEVQEVEQVLTQPLEQAAAYIWLQRHPGQRLIDWPSAPSIERRQSRQRALIASRVDDIASSTSAFLEASLLLLYGQTPVTAERRAQVQDYVESFLEDLGKLFGDIAHEVPALTDLDQLRLVVMPEANERVVVVPQIIAHLLDVHTNPGGLVGRPAAAVEPHIGKYSNTAYWKDFHPQADPGMGYGLLVVRDGLLRRGPYQWDSGD